MEQCLRLRKRKNEYGEYVIKCYLDGVRYPAGDYYTDDWEDAINTFKAIAKDEKLNTREFVRLNLVNGKMSFRYIEANGKIS